MKVLESTPRLELVEMEGDRGLGLCCDEGEGSFWTWSTRRMEKVYSQCLLGQSSLYTSIKGLVVSKVIIYSDSLAVFKGRKN